MAETEKDQRTEEATPRRKDKLREEGKVAKSQDIGAAAGLFAAVIALVAFGGAAAADIVELTQRLFRLDDSDRPLRALEAALPPLVASTLPVLVSSFAVAFAAGMVQTRGLFSLSLLAVKPERLNPVPQLANILPGKQSLIELGKQLLKIVALGVVVFQVVSAATPEFGMLAATTPEAGAATVAAVVTDVVLYGGIAFALIAALDFWLAHRKFVEDAKMSKQDVKDEHKEQEGRPEVKMRRRQRMRELAKQRAVSDVTQATVLVCNPTHIAIALKYHADEAPVPMVIAKGTEAVALAMRAKARKAGVPIVENRPLARSLHATAKIGQVIPVDLYRAVAEVIAHVMRIGGKPL